MACLYSVPYGSLSSHLSLREGSEKPPFPLALYRAGSVLAVKGPLRRFAPLTAPVRSERTRCLRGERGGADHTADFVSHLIAFDSTAPRPKSGVFGPCGRAEREPFGHTRRLEPQPWGAVTRRAVAQRRSRASGLTRPSA